MAERKRRRPNGTGTIRNRGTERQPRWFAYYSVVVDGRRSQLSKGPFPRRSEAEDWLRAEVQRARDGRPTLPSKTTVAELLDEWLAARRPALEPNTYAEYDRIARQRIKPHLGTRKVKDLRPAHVHRMLDALRAPGANLRGKRTRGLSETSLQHTYVALRSALDYAIRQRIVSHNVMEDVERPKREATDIRVWSAEQLARFLDVAAGDRMHALFRLASHSGARRSELLGLRWTHVDLDAATISIVGRRTRVGYQMVQRPGTKTAAGARVVDLDPATIAVLREWKARQEAERSAWGPGYVESGHVFAAENGEPVHADNVRNRFARLVSLAFVSRGVV